METNIKNKELFEKERKEYEDFYKDKFNNEEQLKGASFIFAINQVIRNAAENKDYKITYGCQLNGDEKLFDVVLNFPLFSNGVDKFEVFVDNSTDEIHAYSTKQGEGDITTDKILVRNYDID